MSTLGSDDPILIDGFRFDRNAVGLFRVHDAGDAAPVPLGSRALDLLALLARRRGEAVSKDEIFNEVWSGRAVEEANLNVQISKLRHILDEGRAQGSCIQTLTGYGYRFVGKVRPSEPAALLPSAAPGATTSVPDNATAALTQAEEERPPEVWTVGALHAAQASQALRYAVALAFGIAALLAILVDWRASRPRASGNAPALSLVVLPFTDLSDDHNKRNLADGIVQEVTTELSRVGQMIVVAPSTASAYARKTIGVRAIGQALGVRYVLQGSVDGAGRQIRVAAQLSDAGTAANLWAQRFDRGTGDRLDLEDEISGRIAAALSLAMVRTDAARAVDDPEQSDFILRGRALMTGPATARNRGAAIADFEKALALDPRSVMALSWLARALASGGPETSTPAEIARAKDLVDRALAEAPGSVLAHYARGAVFRAQGRFEDAIPEYQMAIDEDPGWPDAYANLGQSKLYSGAVAEGLTLMERAVRLDPDDPLIGIWCARIGLAHLLLSQIDLAVHWLERARTADSTLPYVYARLSAAQTLRGHRELAAAALAQAQRWSSNGEYATIARLRAASPGSREIRTLYDAVYFPALRLAGVPDR